MCRKIYFQVQQYRMLFRGRNSLQGHQSENTGWLRKFANVSILRLHLVVLFSICTGQEKFFILFACLLFFASDLSQISLLLLVKSTQWLTRYKLGIFATQSSLVHDISGTDCWEQNGSTHSCVFVTLKCRGFNKWDLKLSEKNALLFVFVVVFCACHPFFCPFFFFFSFLF